LSHDNSSSAHERHCVCFCGAGVTRGANQARDSLDAQTAAAGLKEALEIGTGKAIDLLGQVDGYWGNVERSSSCLFTRQ
jgi:hypothetical protein